jgi:protein TonB
MEVPMARQWQTVLVSVVAHVAALFLIVVVPLLAFDGLPALRSAVEYVPVEMKVPPMPAAPRPTIASTTPVPAPGPPLTAPDKVIPEIERPLPTIGAPGIPGGVDGTFPGVTALPGTAVMVPPPAPPPSSEPVRPGGKVKPPDRVVNVRPVYPPMAIAARVSGSVIIEAIIGTDGHVRDAKVLRSIPLLDDAALKAVRQWRYTPTLLNGVPVAVIMTVTVTFTLDRLTF